MNTLCQVKSSTRTPIQGRIGGLEADVSRAQEEGATREAAITASARARIDKVCERETERVCVCVG